MSRDRIDQTLIEFFKPTETPAGLAQRVMRRARATDREAEALLDRLAVSATATGVSLIRLGAQVPGESRVARTFIEQAREELLDYFRGQRVYFSVPVDLHNAPEFQAKVLRAAEDIPFGQARAYAWVAKRIGHPGAVRAVGTALGRNPVPLIVPCHRVLKSDGGMGGYIFGTRLKGRLLEIERTTPVLEGCTSTRIVCRVGCAHLRRVKPENRVVFASVEDARSVGYRACQVCRPTRVA